MVEIVLGYQLDSPAYPDALGNSEAVSGLAVVGFSGLVGILETMLGLSGPQVSEAVRIAQWEQCLRQLDTGSELYSPSFSTDSWNTARELLRRRDELVLAGWNPHIPHGGSSWLAVLVRVESSAALSPGLADRVAALMKRLKTPISLPIKRVRVADEQEDLWEPWQTKLMAALVQNGIVKERYSWGPQSDPDSDLGQLQRVLDGRLNGSEAQGDGSVVLVQAAQEWDAADYLVSWLQAHGSEETVIIRGSGSQLLDQTLQRNGLPALGVNNPSRIRSVLQILPLLISTYWEPIEISRLLELLLLPVSPVPFHFRKKLAYAIVQQPGIGSLVWQEALAEGWKAYEAQWDAEQKEKSERRTEKERLEKRLSMAVSHSYFSPSHGMPVTSIIGICQQIGQWATSRAVNGEPLFMAAEQQSATVMDAVVALGSEFIPRLQLERIMDTAAGAGLDGENGETQAAPWQVVEGPGQLWGAADTVIWWNFYRTDSSRMPDPWTESERQGLKNYGLLLPQKGIARQRESSSWEQAVKGARKRLILIAPSRVSGQPVSTHPFWDHVRYALAPTTPVETKLIQDAANLRLSQHVVLQDVAVLREQIEHKNLPPAIRHWQVPEGLIRPRPEESPTSIETVLGCPLKWTLQYAAHLRDAEILSLPDMNRLIGTVLHHVIHQLFTESLRWTPEEGSVRTIELFDEWIVQMGAPLLEPRNRLLKERTREQLRRTMRMLFATLRDCSLSVDQTEVEVEKAWIAGHKVRGRLDITGTTASGAPMVLDFKWATFSKKYRERLEKLSVQLSLYQWLLAKDPSQELPIGYFMLRTGEFMVSAHPDIPERYHVPGGFSLEDAMRAIESLYVSRMNALNTGEVTATGVLLGEQPVSGVPVDPPCHFCSYQTLCGLNREVSV